MSGFTKTELETRLSNLSISASSIERLSWWIIEHRNHFQAIGGTWLEVLVNGNKDKTKSLIFLYLAHDILQKSKNKHPEFVMEFGDQIKKALGYLVESSYLDDRTNSKIWDLITVWKKHKIFDAKRQENYEKIWKEGTAPSKTLKRESNSYCTSNSSDFPRKRQKSTKLDENAYCYLCQENGHVFSEDCLSRAVCLSCGSKGHIKKDCPSLVTKIKEEEYVENEPVMNAKNEKTQPRFLEKAKLGACESSTKHVAQQFNQIEKASTVISDNSNKATMTVPDTCNMATVSSQSFSNIEFSNLDMEASPDISNMAAIALTTSGSRHLQSIIPDMTAENVNKLQDELLKTPLAVMNHPKATFVIQKLLEVCDSSHLEMYVSTVEQHFTSLSLHPAGCRVVQKCLALANTGQKDRIGIKLENFRTLIKLLRNKNGTYVAQALLPTLSVPTTTSIANSLLGHMVDIGKNLHGTYFIQKLVTGKAQGEVSVQLLIEEIVNNVGYLAHDEFGTRLLQEVLASSSSPHVLSGLSKWLTNNMTAVFKSSAAVFLAKAVIQKLSGVSHGQVCLELLEEMVTSSLETRVDDKPLLIVASLHPVGHGLAKKIVAQANIVPSQSKLLATMNKFSLPLKQDPFGCRVLKTLEEVGGRI